MHQNDFQILNEKNSAGVALPDIRIPGLHNLHISNYIRN